MSEYFQERREASGISDVCQKHLGNSENDHEKPKPKPKKKKTMTYKKWNDEDILDALYLLYRRVLMDFNPFNIRIYFF